VSREDQSISEVVGRTLEALTGLKQTPAGATVYDQIAQIANEHKSSRSRLDQAYGLLMHLLVDAYARDPSAAGVNALNDKLAELQNNAAPSPDIAFAKPASVLAPVASLEPMRALDADASGIPPERRINTSYRLHLDRKRDEIEKLQETLAQGIREAIVQNREFGTLLQVELSALRQAHDEKDIRTLHQILVTGIEELIGSQRLLETKLNQTGDYLSLVKADGERLRDELQKVRLLSLTDEFTGLPNRRAFMRNLQEEIVRAQRYCTPLALALLDLDNFKGVNDLYGHNGGDEVLRSYASQVLNVMRRHDSVARYGGEEFAVMMPNTSESGAIAAINKARQRSQDVRCRIGDKVIQLPTLSAGIAMYQAGESPTDLIERADRALYAAKSLGRNRIELAPFTLTSPPAASLDSSEPQETV
jgi:diguanylate cyclase